jgi:hypothetical protein
MSARPLPPGWAWKWRNIDGGAFGLSWTLFGPCGAELGDIFFLPWSKTWACDGKIAKTLANAAAYIEDKVIPKEAVV